MEKTAWSEAAKRVLFDTYGFWVENRRPPHLGEMVIRSGLGRGELRQVLLELQEGFAIAFHDERLQLNIRKAPPFSAVPTPVLCEMDGDFLSFLGCPAEALAAAPLPVFNGKRLTVRSYCACCYTPIEFYVENEELIEGPTPLPYVSIVASPWDWGPGVPCDRVCDSFHFVIDPDHADRFEREVGRRGAVTPVENLRQNVIAIGRRRMRDPEWGPIRTTPPQMLERMQNVGIDVSVWHPRAT